jgi:hypothetical protein
MSACKAGADYRGSLRLGSFAPARSLKPRCPCGGVASRVSVVDEQPGQVQSRGGATLACRASHQGISKLNLRSVQSELGG